MKLLVGKYRVVYCQEYYNCEYNDMCALSTTETEGIAEYSHCISNDGYGIARNETPGNRPLQLLLLPEVCCLLLLETISDGIDCYICTIY